MLSFLLNSITNTSALTHRTTLNYSYAESLYHKINFLTIRQRRIKLSYLVVLREDLHVCFLSRLILPHQLDAVWLHICYGELPNLQKG